MAGTDETTATVSDKPLITVLGTLTDYSPRDKLVCGLTKKANLPNQT